MGIDAAHPLLFSAKHASVLDKILEFAKANPRLTGTGLGAAGGAGVGYLTSGDDERSTGDHVLDGALVGGSAGFLGGSIYGNMNQPGATPGTEGNLPADIEAREVAKRDFVQKIVDKGKGTPREVNDFQFGAGDMAKKIERAKAYRAQHPELAYIQDLDAFDTTVPVTNKNLKGQGMYGGQVLGLTTATADTSISGLLKGMPAKAQDVFIDVPASDARDVRLSSFPSLLPPDSRTTAFDVLSHELKGHVPQDLSKNSIDPGLNSMLPRVKGRGMLDYLLKRPELERRIQAAKDWGQESLGKQVDSPNDFREILKVLEQSKDLKVSDPRAPRNSDPLDLLEIMNKIRPEHKALFLDYISKMAPGIAKNQGGGAGIAKMGNEFSPAKAGLIGAIPVLGPSLSAAYINHENPDKMTYGNTAANAVFPLIGGVAGGVGGALLGRGLGGNTGSLIGLLLGMSAGQGLESLRRGLHKQQQNPLTKKEEQDRDQYAKLKTTALSALDPVAAMSTLKSYNKNQTPMETSLRSLLPLIGTAVAGPFGSAAGGYMASTGPINEGRRKRASLDELVRLVGEKLGPKAGEILGQQLDNKQVGQSALGAAAGGLGGAATSFMFPSGADEDGPYVSRKQMLHNAMMGAALGGGAGYLAKAALAMAEEPNKEPEAGTDVKMLDSRLRASPWARALLAGLSTAGGGFGIRQTLMPERGVGENAIRTIPSSLVAAMLGYGSGVEHNNNLSQLTNLAREKQASLMDTVTSYLNNMSPEARRAVTGGVVGGGTGLLTGMVSGHPFRNALVGAGVGAGLGYTNAVPGVSNWLQQLFKTKPQAKPAPQAALPPGVPDPSAMVDKVMQPPHGNLPLPASALSPTAPAHNKPWPYPGTPSPNLPSLAGLHNNPQFSRQWLGE